MSKQLKKRDTELREAMIEQQIITKDLLSVSTFAQKNKSKIANLAGILATGFLEADDAVSIAGISFTSYHRITQAAEIILSYLELNDIDYTDTEFEDLIDAANMLRIAEAKPQQKITQAMFEKIDGKFYKDGELTAFEKGASIKDLEILSRHISKRKRSDRATSNNTNVQVNHQTNVNTTPTKIEIIDPEYIMANMYQAQQELIRRTNEEVDLIEQQIENGDFDEI